MIHGFEKESFLDLPTPLHRLDNVSRDLGVDFWIKRDDLTHLGMGGNKLRKLEYLLHEAKQQGATALVTVGGLQTNHGRLTAAVAARYGMKCTICAVDEWPGEVSANVLLDRIMGAEVVVQAPNGKPEDEQLLDLVHMVTEQYESQGEKVYYLPLGGSTVTCLPGYYECAQETDRQAKEKGIGKARFVSAVGSIGTFLGLFIGFHDIGSQIDPTGIAISPFGEEKDRRIMRMFREAKEKMGLGWDAKLEDFHIERGYTRGAYNNADETVRKAVYHMARLEAVLLDPCYTGKAYAGLLEMVKEGKIKQGETVIFLHSGGQPGLNTPHHRKAFEAELMDGVHVL